MTEQRAGGGGQREAQRDRGREGQRDRGREGQRDRGTEGERERGRERDVREGTGTPLSPCSCGTRKTHQVLEQLLFKFAAPLAVELSRPRQQNPFEITVPIEIGNDSWLCLFVCLAVLGIVFIAFASTVLEQGSFLPVVFWPKGPRLGGKPVPVLVTQVEDPVPVFAL